MKDEGCLSIMDLTLNTENPPSILSPTHPIPSLQTSLIPNSSPASTPTIIPRPLPYNGIEPLETDNGTDMEYTLVNYHKKAERRTGVGPISDQYAILPFNPTSPPSKKPRTKKRSIILRESDQVDETWNKYYILAKESGDFSEETPIQLCKMVHAAIGKAQNVKITGAGKVHIETMNPTQAVTLSQLRQLGEIPVNVVPNKRLNTSQGVVACRALIKCTEEEVLEELSDQGVIEVKRIKRKVGGTLQATPSLILTFDRPKPAQSVTAAYYKLDVRPYIPSPMRCFKCLRFGHTSMRCKALEAICGCGMVLHPDRECQDPPICVNCAAEHNARSPACPVYSEEKEIQKLKTEKKMAYFEAKALVKSQSYIKINKSFAQAVSTTSNKRNVKEMSTQTELTPPKPFFAVGGSADGKPALPMTDAGKISTCPSVAPPLGHLTCTAPPQRTSHGPLALPSPDLPHPPGSVVLRSREQTQKSVVGSDERRCGCKSNVSLGESSTTCAGYDSGDSRKTYLSQGSEDLPYGTGMRRRRKKKPGSPKGKTRKTRGTAT